MNESEAKSLRTAGFLTNAIPNSMDSKVVQFNSLFGELHMTDEYLNDVHTRLGRPELPSQTW
jgi:hypothetical protein